MSGKVFADGGWRPHRPGDDDGSGLFETMSARGGALPLWELHLQRLRRSAERVGLAFAPPPDLREVVAECLREQRLDVARVALLAGAGTGSPRWLVAGRRRDAEVEPLPVVLAPAPQGAGGDLKRWPRPALDAARARARADGAHDAILCRGDEVLEATAYNVFVAVGGRLCTPPADGRLLPGIARAVLLRRGLPMEEASVAASDLQHSDLVVLTNAVYGPRWAQLVRRPISAAADALLAQVRAAWRDGLAQLRQ
jgi:branched-subunit amino acid aminotransferase/4-amino-4-deoxychorismate lyase